VLRRGSDPVPDLAGQFQLWRRFRQWRHAPPPRGGLIGTVTGGPGHDRVPAVDTTAITIAVCR